jgi:thiamine phosphate synthase YjbQ (UPF0047 family)
MTILDLDTNKNEKIIEITERMKTKLTNLKQKGIVLLFCIGLF